MLPFIVDGAISSLRGITGARKGVGLNDIEVIK